MDWVLARGLPRRWVCGVAKMTLCATPVSPGSQRPLAPPYLHRKGLPGCLKSALSCRKNTLSPRFVALQDEASVWDANGLLPDVSVGIVRRWGCEARLFMRERVVVIIVEGNRLVGNAIAALLKRSPGFQVVHRVSGAALAFTRSDVLPNAVLLSADTISDNPEVLLEVGKAYPEARLVVVCPGAPAPSLPSLIAAGVRGFITNDAGIGEYVSTLRAVSTGVPVLPSALVAPLFDQIQNLVQSRGETARGVRGQLTRREEEIANLVARGMTNVQIARQLGIALQTVKTHVHSTLKRLSLRNRSQIAVHALAGLQPPSAARQPPSSM